jgi:hypothetical protein
MEAHVPDVKTQEGLCDMIALGNFCELGTILDRLSYTKQMDAKDIEECEVARWHYHQFQVWFCKNYTLSVGGTLVRPKLVFHRSLVEFATALVDHKYVHVDEVPLVECCSALELNKRVANFIESEHSELSDCFDRLMTTGHRNFFWGGKTMKIRVRRPDDDLKETGDFDDFEVFAPEDSESEDEDVTMGMPEDGQERSSSEVPLAALSQTKRKAVEPARE